MLVSKNLIELVAVAVVLTFRTERIAGLDLLFPSSRMSTRVAHGRMSGDPGSLPLAAAIHAGAGDARRAGSDGPAAPRR